MINTQPPAHYDWATELSHAQGHVTLSEQEAHEIGARLRASHGQAPAGATLGSDAIYELIHGFGHTTHAQSMEIALGISYLSPPSTTPQPSPVEQNESAYQRGYMDGMAKGSREVEAAPQQEAHHLTQALTDPENQPNQYGVEFGMSGQQMHFKIGNQLFRLAYEPDDQQEFEFMKCMLIHAFSTFTPDVKAAPQQEAQEPSHRETVDVVGVRSNGEHVNLEKIAMPPRMKAREIAIEQFGSFKDDDGSDAEMCFGALEYFLEWLIQQGWSKAPQPAPAPLSDREEIAMVDAAMVEMANIVPPLKRSECARLIRAAIAAQGGKV